MCRRSRLRHCPITTKQIRADCGSSLSPLAGVEGGVIEGNRALAEEEWVTAAEDGGRTVRSNDRLAWRPPGQRPFMAISRVPNSVQDKVPFAVYAECARRIQAHIPSRGP